MVRGVRPEPESVCGRGSQRPAGCRERPRRVPATEHQPCLHCSAAGHIQLSPVFSALLSFIPKSFGTWTAKGAAEFLFLGETLKPLNDDNVFKPIGRIGSQPCTDGYVVH